MTSPIGSTPRESATRSGRAWHRVARALPWALLVLFAVRGLLAMRADGATVDEPLHLAYGQRALAAGTFVRDSGSLNSKMPVSVLNALGAALAGRLEGGSSAGGGAGGGANVGSAATWARQLYAARLPSLALAVLLGVLVWRWAQLLFGAWGGNLALFLYTFCPNVLAHGHLVTTDIATALGMFAATFCLWRYLAAPSVPRLAVLAAVFGAAQLAKVTALFLVPIFALVLAIRAVRAAAAAAGRGSAPSGWPERPERPEEITRTGAGGWPGARRELARQGWRGTALLLFLGAAAVAVVNAGFCFEGTGTPLTRYTLVSPPLQALARMPAVRDVPLPLPYAYVQGLDMVWHDARAGAWSYLRGRYSATGFRSYFLWAFLVKVPAATQAILLAALWLWASGRVRAPGAEELLGVPVAFQVVYLSFFFELDIGLRYLLPAFPFLFVAAGRVAAPAALAVLAGRGRPRWRAAAAATLPAWLAVSSLSYHPHYIPYFNEWAGGAAHGSRWLIDSNLDWGQDADYVRRVYAPASPVRVVVEPSGPLAGRIAFGLTNLTGRDPDAARRTAWLRDNFQPVATIRRSWEVFDVGEAALARCCAGRTRERLLPDFAADLAARGEPFGGGDGVTVRFADRLNDGKLGADEPVDAARTLPPRNHPVRAWFGITWPAPQRVGRIVAFPGYQLGGAPARRFLALDYVLQSWDGTAWRDIPGTRVAGNPSPRIEHRFPPIAVRGIRLLVDRERNDRGTDSPTGAFRAACLELAAYER